MIVSGREWTRKSTKLSPARLPMMMLGGSPMSVAVPPMLEARISEMRYGAGGQPQSAAHREGHRCDEQHAGDVVEDRRDGGADQHQQDQQPVGMPAGLPGRPQCQELEEPGLLEDADDDHHPEEQEDDVPVDAGVWSKNADLGVDEADHDHRGHAAEGGGDPVDPLGRDEGVADDEDRDGGRGEDHAGLLRTPKARAEPGGFEPSDQLASRPIAADRAQPVLHPADLPRAATARTWSPVRSTVRPMGTNTGGRGR